MRFGKPRTVTKFLDKRRLTWQRLRPKTPRSRKLWIGSADCAEHVLPLFTEVHPSDTRPSHAIAIAREWASGNATIEQARQAAFGAHAAARDSSNSAAIEVARAA